MKLHLLSLIALLAAMAMPAQETPKNTAAPAGFSADGLQRIREYVQGTIDKKEFAGVNILIYRHGQIAMRESFGYQDMEAKQPLKEDTIFRLFSLTKLITATAAMICYDDGKFQLDDPVAKYIPGFANVKVLVSENGDATNVVDMKPALTVRHLLTHTSGLSGARGVFSGTLADMADKVVKVPLARQPGSAWRYSEALDVVARLVEIWSGKTYDAFLQERIFGPLDMKDTGYSVPEEKLARVSKPYRLVNDALVADNPGNPTRKPTYLAGSSDLLSTAGDYSRFGRMLLNGGELDGKRVLKQATVAMMMTPQVPESIIPAGGPNGRRGYGFGLGGAVLLHPDKSFVPLASEGEYNWGGASGVYCWVDRKNDLVGVWFVQRQPWAAGPSDQFKTLVYQAMGKK